MASLLSASSLHICFALFSPHSFHTSQDKRKHGSSHFWGLSFRAQTSGRLPCFSKKSKPWGRNSPAHLNQVSFSGPISYDQEVRPKEKVMVFWIDTLNHDWHGCLWDSLLGLLWDWGYNSWKNKDWANCESLPLHPNWVNYHRMKLKTIPSRLRILQNIVFLWTGIIMVSEIVKFNKFFR